VPHIHELYDFTVGAFLVYEDKVLLVNHPRYGTWLAPGGHIELDEDPEEALFREIKEEAGFSKDEINILSTKPGLHAPGTKFLFTPNFLDTHEANAPHRHIALIYFLTVTHNNHIQSDEHTDSRWFDEKSLKDEDLNIWPATRFYGREALRHARKQRAR